MANLEVLALDEATPQIRAPGSGDGYVMPRPLTLTTGTITTDIKQVDGTVTWNSAGVTFTAWKLNVTDTASNAASLLLDLQVGTVTKAKVTKTGQFVTALTVPSSGTPTMWFSGNAADTGIGATYGPGFTVNGTQRVYVTANGCYVNGEIQSESSGSLIGWADAVIYRDGAANTIGQRRTTNAQTFSLYRTYTDASNYQRLTKTWSTSTAVIHNEGAGTGADGSVAFNDAALATNATKGFVMIPSCAGTPTGTPADIPTGQIPIVFDSTNNKLYVYDGGWLATATLT